MELSAVLHVSQLGQCVLDSGAASMYAHLWHRLQPNPSTLSHQIDLWTTLVLNWARHARIWEINVDSPDPPEVFVNKSINRELAQS